jgi:hypothetical protein
MTFDQIVSRVMDRLNLTSDAAQTRVGERVNEVYKDVTTSIGLVTSRRVALEVTTDPQAVGSTLPELEIEGIEKITRITYTVDGGIKRLDELMYDDLTSKATATSMPTAWALKRMGSGTVTIVLDAFPEDEFTLIVDGYETADELADDAEPNLPVSFHDLLVEGAMALELRKMEKPQLAQIADGRYAQRLSDLRMFIAKSAYLDILQGKNKPAWYYPWMK